MITYCYKKIYVVYSKESNIKVSTCMDIIHMISVPPQLRPFGIYIFHSV